MNTMRNAGERRIKRANASRSYAVIKDGARVHIFR